MPAPLLEVPLLHDFQSWQRDVQDCAAITKTATLETTAKSLQNVVDSLVPNYDLVLNPIEALAKRSGNCVARSAIVHALTSAAPNYIPIVHQRVSHFSNIVVKSDDLDEVAILENNMFGMSSPDHWNIDNFAQKDNYFGFLIHLRERLQQGRSGIIVPSLDQPGETPLWSHHSFDNAAQANSAWREGVILQPTIAFYIGRSASAMLSVATNPSFHALPKDELKSLLNQTTVQLFREKK